MRPRPLRLEGDIAYVTLTKGYSAIVDADDVHLVEGHNWHAFVTTRTVYAARSEKSCGRLRTIFMHRLILGDPIGLDVDHRDHDGLNNRRCNLRGATAAQNSQNQRASIKNTSGFKGVSWSQATQKWQAQIRVGGRLKYLGLFDIITDAAGAYDTAALTHFGGFAQTNLQENANV